MVVRGLSAMTSLAYVGSVYLLPGGRSSELTPGVLLRRMIGVITLTGFTVVNFGINPTKWLAIDASVVHNVIKAILLLHVLYLPQLLAEGFPRLQLKNVSKIIQTVRALLVGPITEEFVYRGVIVPRYLHDGISAHQTLAENWVYFGLAHVHHGFMQWLENTSAKVAAVQALVHFVMTSLFGTYACYWLLQTGSVWPSVVSHMLCNFYGPVSLSGPKWYLPLLVLCTSLFIYGIGYI